MAVDSHGMPIRIIVTEGSRNDCTQADRLIEDIDAENLIADKAYDTNNIVETAEKSSINPVIPSKRNRKTQRDVDSY
ncbi:MAG: Transposase [Rickettsiaceae bacterium]|jgi:transposase|nr:Transposase [Rickettsiaceae bacterium]